MREEILKKIKYFKNKKYGEVVIDCNYNGNQYELYYLTLECSKNEQLMGLLSSWRKMHEVWFPSQFEVTVERTASWFENRVMGATDRLLFMIKTDNGYVGHVGLFRFDFDNESCEIDNIVRGEKTLPGIMGDAIKNMMEWGRKELGLKFFTLQTSSDNERAIKLYENLGFVEFKRIPLLITEKDGQREWLPAPSDYKGIISRYDIFMSLNQ